MKKSTENKINKILNQRWLKTLILTIILFTIGVSDYLIQKSLAIGGCAIVFGASLVWFLLWITRIDEIIFK